MSESESDNKNTTIFASESDADNMYGGNDPDDILGSGTSYLRSIGVKAAVEYEGSILSLLEGKDDVDLNGIVMKSGQFQDLCKHIQKSDNLKTISVRNGQMTDDQFTQFADSLIKSSSKPVMLNLSLNKLGDNSAEKIVEMMTDNPSINILILHGNPMKDNGIKTLMDGLLDLHYARIPDQEDTMSSSPEFCELKELDLGHTKMTNVGVEHVGRLLAANTSLKSLYMMGNKDITYTGWKTLGKALSQNTTLENLSLDFNNMRDVGIAALVTGLKDNQSVKQLDLEGSGLSDEGGKKLVELLKCNTTILDITLSPGNNISEKIQDDIRNYLGLNRAAANTKTF